MPRVSAFYGIVIGMFWDEERHRGRPHFHARCGDHEASYDIETLEPIVGRLPRRADKLVVRWGRLHRDELRHNWQLLRTRQAPFPIDPLP
jgi:Domain of unknown function (DUF4160)